MTERKAIVNESRERQSTVVAGSRSTRAAAVIPSIKRQCELLKVARSSLYYEPAPTCVVDLVLMRIIDEVHVDEPFLGSRRMTTRLRKDHDHQVSRKRVQRLMRLMGVTAIYPKPKTTLPGGGPLHEVYPYLLGNLDVDSANVAWGVDVTYIPMARGFAYLVAIIDVYSRRILSWRLSNTLDARFCVEALEEALRCYGRPLVFNSDQGRQFTSRRFTQVLKDAGVRISMDGRGAWRDNVFIERFWWTLKHEEVYLRAYENLWHARSSIEIYMNYYNDRRYHTMLNNCTPATVYDESISQALPLPDHPPAPAVGGSTEACHT